MLRRRKALMPDAPLAPVPSEILDQFVRRGRSRLRSSTRRSYATIEVAADKVQVWWRHVYLWKRRSPWFAR
jgi:hypothetical protein